MIAAIVLTLLASSPPSDTPDASAPRTLDEVLSFADAHAPALLVEEARLGYGDAARSAAAPWFPSNPQVQVATGPSFDAGAVGFDLEASLQQQIEVGGQPGLRREAAERLRDRLVANVDAARAQVRAAARGAFRGALVARERRRAAEVAAAFADDVMQLTERRIGAGDVSPLVGKIASADVAAARRDVVEARGQESAAFLALAQIIGWPAAAPLDVEGAPPASVPLPELAELVRRAAEANPAIRALRADVDEARARLVLADREALPSPSVGVGYAVERAGLGGGPGEHAVLGLVQMPLPVWQTNQGERGRTHTDVEVAEAVLASRMNALTARLGAGRARAMAAAEAITLMEGATAGLDEALVELRRGFELGELDALDVAQARDRLLQSRRRLLDAQGAFADAISALETELGDELR